MDTHGSNIDACVMALNITGDPVADEILSEDPFALLAGMMLDQQFPMERAFAGPAKILDRFGTLDPATIAAAPPEEFAEICARPPAVHRFPGSMAARLQALAPDRRRHATTATRRRCGTPPTPVPELFKRLTALPGFGKQKAQIFVALLGKQLDVRPDGLGDGRGGVRRGGFLPVGGRRPDPASLEKVRSFKKEQKAGQAQLSRVTRPRAGVRRRAPVGPSSPASVSELPATVCSGSTPAHTPACDVGWSSDTRPGRASSPTPRGAAAR